MSGAVEDEDAVSGDAGEARFELGEGYRERAGDVTGDVGFRRSDVDGDGFAVAQERLGFVREDARDDLSDRLLTCHEILQSSNDY